MIHRCLLYNKTYASLQKEIKKGSYTYQKISQIVGLRDNYWTLWIEFRKRKGMDLFCEPKNENEWIWLYTMKRNRSTVFKSKIFKYGTGIVSHELISQILYWFGSDAHAKKQMEAFSPTTDVFCTLLDNISWILNPFIDNGLDPMHMPVCDNSSMNPTILTLEHGARPLYRNNLY